MHHKLFCCHKSWSTKLNPWCLLVCLLVWDHVHAMYSNAASYKTEQFHELGKSHVTTRHIIYQVDHVLKLMFLNPCKQIHRQIHTYVCTHECKLKCLQGYCVRDKVTLYYLVNFYRSVGHTISCNTKCYRCDVIRCFYWIIQHNKKAYNNSIAVIHHIYTFVW